MENVDVSNEIQEFEATTRYDGMESWRDMNSIYYVSIFLPWNDNTSPQALLLKRFEGIETIMRHFKSIMTILNKYQKVKY